jgi:acetyltransferase-like isoleucine patch superfamily enzyme
VIEIHPSARVSPLADIEASIRGTRIVIGPDTVIDSFVKIKPTGGSGDVIIGAGCHLNSGTVFYSGNGIRLGDGVLVAANCTLAPVNHEYRKRSETIVAQRFGPSRGGIDIGSDSWLGAGCVVLDGATVGEGCVIGALSLVRGVLPAYSVCVGRPARPVGERS